MKRFVFCLIMLVIPALAAADECCDCKCDHCGCQAHCQKVCRVICEMKDEKVTCYCCKEEDICIPGHSKKCGEVCEPNPCCLAHPKECDSCGCNQCGNGCDECHHPHSLLDCFFGHDCCEKRTVWQASCSGEIRSVNKLIKYEATKKVPTFKWVVEYQCDQCRGCNCPCNATSATAPAPAAGAVQAAPQPAIAQNSNAAAPPTTPSTFVPVGDVKPTEPRAFIVNSELLGRLSK